MLVMHRVDVCRQDAPILRHASLRSESPGLLFLVGPGGAGKSTLLAALAGQQGQEAPRLSGMAEVDGLGLGLLQGRRVWVEQNARLDPGRELEPQLLERCPSLSSARICSWLARLGVDHPLAALHRPASELDESSLHSLAVLAALQSPAALYLVDEPTAHLRDAHIEIIRQRLAELATTAVVVVATHNRKDCLALGGRTALLAGGTVQECAETERFFTAPQTAAGRCYVETGNCSLPPVARPQPRGEGIWWVVPGLLGGMSRPGLVSNAASQYRRLAEQGVALLVCMEEQVEYPLEPARAEGLRVQHLPVPDMAPPSFNQAVDLCRLAEPFIGNNQGVVLHCRGGLGRTGTGLAAILAWFGDEAELAIAKIRGAQPHAIQSVAQLRFLHDFAGRIRAWQ